MLPPQLLAKGNMFEYLKNFDIVLVTGPQRSGTTIAAKMIAQDTGKPFFDEGYFGVLDVVRFCDTVTTTTNGVIQCPGMCRYVHWFGKRDDLCVVLMRRNVDEIIKSEARIKWDGSFELSKYGTIDGPVSAVKYSFWDNYQKAFIKHSVEIEYRSLTGHPLWIPDERRVNFTFKQTEEEIQNSQVEFWPMC